MRERPVAAGEARISLGPPTRLRPSARPHGEGGARAVMSCAAPPTAAKRLWVSTQALLFRVFKACWHLTGKYERSSHQLNYIKEIRRILAVLSVID